MHCIKRRFLILCLSSPKAKRRDCIMSIFISHQGKVQIDVGCTESARWTMVDHGIGPPGIRNTTQLRLLDGRDDETNHRLAHLAPSANLTNGTNQETTWGHKTQLKRILAYWPSSFVHWAKITLIIDSIYKSKYIFDKKHAHRRRNHMHGHMIHVNLEIHYKN